MNYIEMTTKGNKVIKESNHYHNNEDKYAIIHTDSQENGY